MSKQYPLIVSGASGQLGRKVVTHLLHSLNIAPENIIALSRRPEDLADFAVTGVQVRAADFDDAVSLATAFAGGKRLLLISTNVLDVPGKRLQQHTNAVNAAKQAGIGHILYTSLPKPETSAILFAADHLKTEQVIQSSGISWTFLRNNWYFENLFLSLGAALASGNWYSAAGEGRIAHISRDDLAYAAAVALASDDVGNKTYTLTGSESYSTAEIVAKVKDIAGKPLELVPVTDEQKVAGLQQAGFPEYVANVFASIDTGVRLGDLADITTDFVTLTGKQPQSYQSWLTENRAVIKG